MEFSRTFRVAFLVTVYLSVLAFADINEDKKNALKKVDTQYEGVQKLIEDTRKEVNKRTGYVKIIDKYWREFGDVVIADINVKTQKTSKTGSLMADLLKSPADVVKCIQVAEREALEDNKAYYNRSFIMIIAIHEDWANRDQQQVTEYWEQDVKAANKIYAEIYKSDKDEINAAKDTSAISAVLKKFNTSTKSMTGQVLRVYNELDKVHLMLVDYIMTYVPLLVDYGIRRNDQLAKDLHKCFSKY